jgi:hypothetical protein
MIFYILPIELKKVRDCWSANPWMKPMQPIRPNAHQLIGIRSFGAVFEICPGFITRFFR